MIDRIVRRASGVVDRAILRLLARARRDRLVPFELVRGIRRISLFSDVLLPPSTPVDGSLVRDQELAKMLVGTELGVWSLGPGAIDFLGDLVDRHRPRLIVEFGSGISTLALAHFLSLLGPATHTRLVSLEQDDEHAKSTRALLEARGLGQGVTVIYSALTNEVIEGKTRVSYSLNPEVLEAVRDRSPDFVVIDGPAAGTGGRFATLTLLRSHVRKATFVMDDAFRDSELETAAEWTRLSLATLDGIRPVEKGLLVGTFTGSSQHSIASGPA